MNFYHLIILDASGSMSCIEKQALNGCNETIQSIRSLQKKQPETQHHVSLVTFNSDMVTNLIYDCQPIAEAEDLSPRLYRPEGCTPLYDCVGLSLCRLRDTIRKQENPQVLVTIITDGEENSSTLFDAVKVRSLVEELKPQGWTFAFIGANQDEVLEAQKMGIHNSLAFEQSEEGTSGMFSILNEAREEFCCSCKAMPMEERETGFFKRKKK